MPIFELDLDQLLIKRVETWGNLSKARYAEILRRRNMFFSTLENQAIN